MNATWHLISLLNPQRDTVKEIADRLQVTNTAAWRIINRKSIGKALAKKILAVFPEEKQEDLLEGGFRMPAARYMRPPSLQKRPIRRKPEPKTS